MRVFPTLLITSESRGLLRPAGPSASARFNKGGQVIELQLDQSLIREQHRLEFSCYAIFIGILMNGSDQPLLFPFSTQ